MSFYWSYCPVKLQKFSRCQQKQNDSQVCRFVVNMFDCGSQSGKWVWTDFSFLFHINRSKNFKILEVGQMMILRKGKPWAPGWKSSGLWAEPSCTPTLKPNSVGQTHESTHWSSCLGWHTQPILRHLGSPGPTSGPFLAHNWRLCLMSRSTKAK